jgi:hypothetical protein
MLGEISIQLNEPCSTGTLPIRSILGNYRVSKFPVFSEKNFNYPWNLCTGMDNPKLSQGVEELLDSWDFPISTFLLAPGSNQ